MKIDDYIQAKTADGNLDSKGIFEVDSLAALRKTLCSGLPQPHYYLFHIIQGLHAAKCSDIQVGIGRRKTTVSFTDPDQRFQDLEALKQLCISNHSLASMEAEELLAAGLITAFGYDIRNLEYRPAGLHKRLLISEETVEVVAAIGEKPRSQLSLHRAVGKGLSFSWSRIWGARKEEFRLRKRFEYCPIPLNLAGLSTQPHPSWRRAVSPPLPAVLLEAALLTEDNAPNHCGEPMPELNEVSSRVELYESELTTTTPVTDSDSEDQDDVSVLASNVFSLALDESGEPLQKRIEPEDWNRRKWSFYFTSRIDQPSEILFVRNGCSIERIKADLGIRGLQVVAPADDLKVDASGYALIDNEDRTKRIDEAKSLVLKISKHLSRQDLQARKERHPQTDLETLYQQFPWVE